MKLLPDEAVVPFFGAARRWIRLRWSPQPQREAANRKEELLFCSAHTFWILTDDGSAVSSAPDAGPFFGGGAEQLLIYRFKGQEFDFFNSWREPGTDFRSGELDVLSGTCVYKYQAPRIR